ncbi:DUF4158 domain-containing protein [Streptomyces sp. NPDC053474]|uniref:DUF4158 domain-containing protein n=1 Tax=Streptomyces sp. NPDC053474 TaxID=3365704 RepID=UPI0037CFAC61
MSVVGRGLGLDQVVEHFTLDTGELALLRNKTGARRLGFTAMLKFLLFKGRCPRGRFELADDAVDHLARQAKVPAGHLGFYDFTDRTAKAHRGVAPVRTPRPVRWPVMMRGGVSTRPATAWVGCWPRCPRLAMSITRGGFATRSTSPRSLPWPRGAGCACRARRSPAMPRLPGVWLASTGRWFTSRCGTPVTRRRTGWPVRSGSPKSRPARSGTRLRRLTSSSASWTRSPICGSRPSASGCGRCASTAPWGWTGAAITLPSALPAFARAGRGRCPGSGRSV